MGKVDRAMITILPKMGPHSDKLTEMEDLGLGLTLGRTMHTHDY